jgi:predicted nucleic acid-binding protein
VIFVDTSFLFALISAKDEHHERVLDVFRSFQGKHLRDEIITTNHVVAETITLSRKLGHAPAASIGERLFGEKLARIHWATPDEELAAFAYFKRHDDQLYSFVDCLSFVVMEKLGIREALAIDSDFTHRFIALPGPRHK